MMDRDCIATELAKDLDRALVKPPPPGKYGEYISAFDAITTANRIFSWDGWNYTIDRLEQTNCDPDQGRNNDQWAIGYMAIVTVTVEGVHKQDAGHGQGHSKSLGDAHDSAMKEAVTDALKRALRTFGNPLGLALYDKTKAHVSDVAADERKAAIADAPPPPVEAIEQAIIKMQDIWGKAELGAYWNGLAEFQPGMQSVAGVAEAKDAQKAAIEAKESA